MCHQTPKNRGLAFEPRSVSPIGSKPRTREAELWEMTEAVAGALQRAELRLMERAELGVGAEGVGSMAASMAEAAGVRVPSGGPRETEKSKTNWDLEVMMVLFMW